MGEDILGRDAAYHSGPHARAALMSSPLESRPGPSTAVGGVTLAFTTVSATGTPAKWLGVLHGIYGRGRNWSGVAKRFVELRPEWGVVLIDLRNHGSSPDFAPPHTVDACAEDVRRTLTQFGAPVEALAGHSFGGKVAMRAAELLDTPHLWIMDSTPQARPPGGTAWEMLSLIEAVPATFASRTDLIDALRRAGVAEGVAGWMATNLVSVDGAYRWRLDFAVMRTLLADFFASDLWRVIEHPDAARRVHVVKAAASSILDDADCARIEQAALRHGQVQLHRIEGGHWVNTDNPSAVVELWRTYLP